MEFSIKKIEGILLDVDGTLTNTERVVTPRTSKVLKRLIKKGVRVGVATGRTFASLKSYILPMFPKDSLHIVASGGQVTSSSGKIIWQKLIPHEKVAFLTEKVEKKGAYFIFGKKDTLYASSPVVPNLLKHQWSIKADYASSISDYSTPQISIVSINEEVRKFLHSQKDVNAEEIITGYKPSYFDVTAKGINKGITAQIWARELGISLKNTLCVGDSVNDIELMKVVGYSAAMGHSVGSVKEAAQMTIGNSQEDGLAVFLEKLLT